MDLKTLLTAYEAVDMLNALGLPVSEEQQKAISELELAYLDEEVIPTIKKEMEPFMEPLRGSIKINICHSAGGGLKFQFENNSREITDESDDKSSGGDRTKYSIDGGKPLNKRRFVLAVVKEYVKSHPDSKFEELEGRFPSSLSHSATNGVVRKYDEIRARIEQSPDLLKRFFLDPEDIIRLSDGTKVVVYNQWGNSFANFLAVAKELHRVETFGL